MIFYFSGTGNSKWIARQLAQRLGEECIFIPDALREGRNEYRLGKGEKIGFVFPVYSWSPPGIVLQFIRQLSLVNYYSHYLFYVCSCGDDIGLTDSVFKKEVKKKGWRCSAAFSVTMPNNYVLLPGFNVDSKEVEKEKLQNSIGRVKQIGQWLQEEKEICSYHEGSFAFIKTRLINPLFTKWQMSPKGFHAQQICIGCKRCQSVCPMKNISIKDGRPVWGDVCTSCLACYHICPQQAVQYTKRTIHKGRYIHPEFGEKL